MTKAHCVQNAAFRHFHCLVIVFAWFIGSRIEFKLNFNHPESQASGQPQRNCRLHGIEHQTVSQYPQHKTECETVQTYLQNQIVQHVYRTRVFISWNAFFFNGNWTSTWSSPTKMESNPRKQAHQPLWKTRATINDFSCDHDPICAKTRMIRALSYLVGLSISRS